MPVEAPFSSGLDGRVFLTRMEMLQLGAFIFGAILLLLLALWLASHIFGCLGKLGSVLRNMLLNWLYTAMFLVLVYVAAQHSTRLRELILDVLSLVNNISTDN